MCDVGDVYSDCDSGGLTQIARAPGILSITQSTGILGEANLRCGAHALFLQTFSANCMTWDFGPICKENAYLALNLFMAPGPPL